MRNQQRQFERNTIEHEAMGRKRNPAFDERKRIVDEWNHYFFRPLFEQVVLYQRKAPYDPRKICVIFELLLISFLKKRKIYH